MPVAVPAFECFDPPALGAGGAGAALVTGMTAADAEACGFFLEIVFCLITGRGRGHVGRGLFADQFIGLSGGQGADPCGRCDAVQLALGGHHVVGAGCAEVTEQVIIPGLCLPG